MRNFDQNMLTSSVSSVKKEEDFYNRFWNMPRYFPLLLQPACSGDREVESASEQKIYQKIRGAHYE